MRRLWLVLLGAATIVALSGIEGPIGASVERDGDFRYATRIHPEVLDDAELARALDMARTAGVNTVDTEVYWAFTDRGAPPGSYDWRNTDRLVDGARARGMEVNLLLTQTPDWVHPGVARTVSSEEERKHYPPRGSELGLWKDFVRAVVGRYEGRVGHYEMWNEPNNRLFWLPHPDAGQYATFLRASYLAAKEADPEAIVVFGGLSGNDLGYLTEYYRVVKAAYPDAADDNYFFDVLGVHPYSYDRSPDYAGVRLWPGPYGAGTVDWSFLGIRRMKELMERQGDSGKELYLSEYGHPTSESLGVPGTPDARRALYLKRAYELAREAPYVKGMSWYAFHPNAGDPPEWTLLDESLAPSLSYRSYKHVANPGARDVRIEISVPSAGSDGNYHIRPRVTGLDPSEISRWELYVDGTLVREQAGTPMRWDAGDAEPDTRVMVAAYTVNGSVWHSNVAVPGGCGVLSRGSAR